MGFGTSELAGGDDGGGGGGVCTGRGVGVTAVWGAGAIGVLLQPATSIADARRGRVRIAYPTGLEVMVVWVGVTGASSLYLWRPGGFTNLASILGEPLATAALDRGSRKHSLPVLNRGINDHAAIR